MLQFLPKIGQRTREAPKHSARSPTSLQSPKPARVENRNRDTNVIRFRAIFFNGITDPMSQLARRNRG